MNALKQISVAIFTISLFCSMTCTQNSDILFANKPNSHLFWQALIQAAKQNKEAALKIIEIIKSEENNLPDFLTEESQSKNIDNLFDKLFLSEMYRNPQGLSRIGLFESIGIYEHNAYLNNVSPHAMLLDIEEKEKNLQLLKKYDLNELSAEQKISYKIFLWSLKHDVEGKKFLFHDYHICHMFGILSDLTNVFTQFHPLETAEHINLYITRLGHVSKQLKQSITLLEHQRELGITPPAFSLLKVINMIQKLTPTSVEKNIFYSHLKTRIEKIEIPNKKQLLAKAASIIENNIYPAYKILQKYLKTILSKTTANNGVWALPNGDEYYAYKLRHHTTADLSADEIHELGLQEVHKIQAKIEKLLKKEELELQDLFEDPQFYYPQTKEGRKQCLTDYEGILLRSRKELSHLFDLQPKTPVKIQAVPQHEEKDTFSFPHYLRPSIDGSRPGIFFVNLGYLHESPKFEMETVAIHEAEPGHHFQISLQQESDMPILRKLGFYNAYAEGWALYAEKLASEQGFYSTSFDQLGNLIDDMLRAVRLVVDTGIHKKRWTQEQAFNYMKKYTGFPKETIISEVERYFVLPGQACSYKIGQLKILELRQRAKGMLGKEFDIREFHNVVLKIGATPLTILEEAVEQYIQDKLTT